MQRQTGIVPPELAQAVPCPEGMWYLWDWYWRVVNHAEPLRYTELEAWCRLNKRSLTEYELWVLKEMDIIRLEVAAND